MLSKQQSSRTKVIYKYRLTPGLDMVEMPADAELLHVRAQGSEAFIWALVDPGNKKVHRRIVIVPTGIGFSADHLVHVGTFEIREPDEPPLIFHVFDSSEEWRQ